MRRCLFLLLMLASATLAAQPMITSSGPSTVSVTIYRGDQEVGEPFDLESLSGFALITETREVELPPGVVTIRFEGVASGIEPASALVFGVSVKEKNRDRRLLSQRGLLDAFTGQVVTIRRTDKATGKVTEQPGTIRSNPDGLVLQTTDGFESVYCTGLDQTLVFPNVPPDLTAKPTLSVTTNEQPGGRQIITLSYLAGHFDWQANYVGELSADARHMDLLAWLTMASGDQTSFVDANAYAVAGSVARVANDDGQADEGEAEDLEISYHCWPRGTTSSTLKYKAPMPPPPEVLQAPMMGMAAAELSMEEIMVTANRRAEREDLGDLKLYRIPFAVTVAAHSQKQAVFLSKTQVVGEMLYRSRFVDGDGDEAAERIYRVQNTLKAGLGEALPQGRVALFQAIDGHRMLVGEASLDDRAVGEDVDLELGEASNVSVSVEDSGKSGDNWDGYVLAVTNANPFAITYEAEFQSGEDVRYDKFGERLFERKGRLVWRVVVPPNSRRKLGFREVETYQ